MHGTPRVDSMNNISMSGTNELDNRLHSRSHDGMSDFLFESFYDDEDAVKGE